MNQTIEQIMADIHASGMGIGVWLGEWDDDFFLWRGDVQQYSVEIYPTDDYINHYETGEPWGQGRNESFEAAIRAAYDAARRELERWREQKRTDAEEETS